MSSTEVRARKLFHEHMGVPKNKITMDANIQDDLGGDSLDEIELVIACEEEFGIVISDEAAEKITSFGDAVKHIEQAIGRE